MLHIDNDAVARVLRIEDAVHALHAGYREYAQGLSALVPRVDLWAPTARSDGYYCLGTMAGTSPAAGVTALRIKSDVIYWPAGKTQEKFSKEPGLYCGFILVFDNATGEPVALINDGVLQHVRVGAAAGVAIDVVTSDAVDTLGLLGSGGMAETMLGAAMAVRDFRRVTVFSPTAENRDAFVARMGERYPDVEVAAADDTRSAIGDSAVVVSATDSMVPTLDPAIVRRDATVVTVSRREIAEAGLDEFDRILQLGRHTFPPTEALPEMVYPQSGMAGFVAGDPDQQTRLPWKMHANRKNYPTLIELLARGDRHPLDGGRTLVMNTGTQGIQFATIAGLVLRLVREENLGHALSQEMFMQDIRD